MKVLAIIPARYASSRFPGKPLCIIKGKTMLEWVYLRTRSCSSIQETLIATDDQRILDVALAFGAPAVMTSADHISGTDRIREVVQLMGADADIILNVQGDEPTIDPKHLEALIAKFQKGVDIATLVTPFRDQKDFKDPNRVKAIIAQSGKALYFTRSAAPYDRHDPADLDLCHQHIGVYGYRRDVLEKLTALDPSPLEKKESLEQLRWLEHGFNIHAAIVDRAPIGVDTPEDLERVKAAWS